MNIVDVLTDYWQCPHAVHDRLDGSGVSVVHLPLGDPELELLPDRGDVVFRQRQHLGDRGVLVSLVQHWILCQGYQNSANVLVWIFLFIFLQIFWRYYLKPLI